MSKDKEMFMFAEQRGMVLFNPTDDDFDMQYSGVSFTMKPGQKTTFDANAANHLLNAFGQRGLCYLAYGADEKQIGEDGKKRNKEFKKRMVTDFNFRNENRKTTGLNYLIPSPTLMKYAEELNLELFEPYAARDAEKDKLSAQEVELSDMRKQMAALMAKLESLTPKDEPKQVGNPNWKKKE